MALLENWIELLCVIYRKYKFFGENWFTFKDQEIINSHKAFLDFMRDFEHYGWITSRETKNGSVVSRYFKLTDYGFMVVHQLFIYIYRYEKEGINE